MVYKWENGFKPERLLLEFESHTKVTNEGAIEFTSSPYSTSILETLISRVWVTNKFPDQILHGLKRSGILKARKSGDFSPDTVLEEVKAEVTRYSYKPRKKYLVVTSFSSRGHGAVTRTLGGIRIGIGAPLTKNTKESRNAFLESHKHSVKTSLPSGYSAVHGKISARTGTEAGYLALDQINTVRSIWNLFYNQEKTSGDASPPRPINDILIGPLHSIHYQNGRLAGDSWFYDPSYIKQDNKKNIGDDYKKLLRFELKWRTAIRHEKLGPIINECLLRYCEALDQANVSDAFLRLWTVLEKLTQTGRDNYDTTIRRASFLWQDDWAVKQILETIRRKRNEAVHEYKQESINYGLLYDLKRFVETLLRFYLWASKELTTIGEVKDFLDQPRTKDELSRKRRLARLAAKWR